MRAMAGCREEREHGRKEKAASKAAGKVAVQSKNGQWGAIWKWPNVGLCSSCEAGRPRIGENVELGDGVL